MIPAKVKRLIIQYLFMDQFLHRRKPAQERACCQEQLNGDGLIAPQSPELSVKIGKEKSFWAPTRDPLF